MGDLVLFKVNIVPRRLILGRTRSLEVGSNTLLRIGVHSGATPHVADRETWGVTILSICLLSRN